MAISLPLGAAMMFRSMHGQLLGDEEPWVFLVGALVSGSYGGVLGALLATLRSSAITAAIGKR